MIQRTSHLLSWGIRLMLMVAIAEWSLLKKPRLGVLPRETFLTLRHLPRTAQMLKLRFNV
ncbi:hypothetical protein AKJ16_DCAP20316 [Drosera capensis]